MAVIPLVEATDIALVGGKAAALGQLLREGYNVPAGFVVPANSRPSEAEVDAAFGKLASPLVAVRSSAVNEDGKNASWAGQFDTFLSVTRNGVIEKIQACIDSAANKRAGSYGNPGAVAVLVQAMVQSEVGGVAFSVHPITHNENQIIIEAVLGLGESLVSGEVTPDNYTVDKASGKVLAKILAPPEGPQKITDSQIKEVSALTAKLEKDMGYPVDVEWAWAKGRLCVLQCRPITSLA